ncbi:MAG: 3'-5' exonuclease [Clostridia bacterium]|nr:3'-5' exonuclease [Clostridia bacterium]
MQGREVPKFYETVTPEAYADDETRPRAALPDTLTDNVYVVLDIETTGLRSYTDRIIEIGACRIVGGEITETFSSLINPRMNLPWYITDVTGITDKMLRGAPTYERVLPDFYKFCDGTCLVGHNIDRFDINFLNNYWGLLGFDGKTATADTLKLAHKRRPGLVNYKLPTIAAAYGYTFDGRTHHRALDDAIITAKIFLDMETGQNL